MRISAMTGLLVEGKLQQSGFVRQEEAKLSDFLANRFGLYYAIQSEPFTALQHLDWFAVCRSIAPSRQY